MPAGMKAKRTLSPIALTRSGHSQILQRGMEAKGTELPAESAASPASGSSPEKAEKGTNPLATEDSAEHKAALTSLTAKAEEFKLKKSRSTCMVEQVLRYSPGHGQPLLEVRLLLTTAVRGQRINNRLKESAYLMRLEILAVSPAVKVEAFGLGPWQASRLQLEAGSIYIPEPIWTTFQPATNTSLRGRLLLGDGARGRILDLPWKTEAIVPGPEPFSG